MRIPGWSVLLCSGVIACTVTESGCKRPQEKTRTERTVQAMKSIDDVIKQHADSLMAIPGVVGLYHGLDEDGSACVKVMVKKQTLDMEKRIPRMLEGYPVVIEESGEIRPME